MAAMTFHRRLQAEVKDHAPEHGVAGLGTISVRLRETQDMQHMAALNPLKTGKATRFSALLAFISMCKCPGLRHAVLFPLHPSGFEASQMRRLSRPRSTSGAFEGVANRFIQATPIIQEVRHLQVWILYKLGAKLSKAEWQR